MCGYIINLYKYASWPESHQEHFFNLLGEKQEKNRRTGQRFEAQGRLGFEMQSLLTYGDFDRINIQLVKDFSRYRDIGPHTQNWLGPRQSILVYTIPAGGIREHQPNDLLHKILMQGREALHPAVDDYRFMVLTMITLAPGFRLGGKFTDKLRKCRYWILETVDTLKRAPDFLHNPDRLDCEVYGTFSPSELLVVWHTEQYTDALKIADALRYISISFNGQAALLHPFSTLYSIVSQAGFSPAERNRVGCETFIYGEAELAFQQRDISNDPRRIKVSAAYFDKLAEELNGMIAKRREVLEKSGGDFPTLKNIEISSNVGEYDYCIRLPADIVCNPQFSCFHSGGILHWKNEKFATSVKQTRTNLYYNDVGLPCKGIDETYHLKYDAGLPQSCCSEENIFSYEIFSHINEKIYGVSNQEIREFSNLTRKNFMRLYQQCGLRWIIRRKFPETVGMCDTLDLLYLDYVNNCSNLINDSWAVDLSAQFSNVLEYIAYLIYQSLPADEQVDPTDPLDPDKLFSGISQIINDFKQVIYHVAQSKRTVFIVPSCHLRYLGQYDLILHAYYGLQKYLIKLAYRLNSTEWQPELIPMYTIDVVPELKIQLYKIEPIYEEGRPEEDWKHHNGIFSINLPFAAIGDFLRYSMMIAHETFHQVVPKDRNRRNQVLGLLQFAEVCARITLTGLLEYYQELPEDMDDIDSLRQFLKFSFDNLVMRLVSVYCAAGAKFYKETYHDRIQSKRSGELFPIWNDYQETLIRKIGNELILDDEDSKRLFAEIAAINAANQELLKRIITEFLGELERIYETRNGHKMLSGEQHNEIIKKATVYIDFPDPSGFHTRLSMEKLTEHTGYLSEGFREASQDLPMIRIFGLSFVDYLVFRDRHKHDLLDLGKKSKLSDRWRIAMLCDYLLTEELEAAGNRNPTPRHILRQLEQKRGDYLTLFARVPEMQGHSVELSREEEQLCERAFDLTYRSVVDYFELFGRIHKLIAAQLKDADIIEDADIREELHMRSFLADAYQNWKAALNIETDEDGMKEEADQKRNDAIFENNMMLIHYFQEQGSISNPDALKDRNQKMTQ